MSRKLPAWRHSPASLCKLNQSTWSWRLHINSLDMTSQPQTLQVCEWGHIPKWLTAGVRWFDSVHHVDYIWGARCTHTWPGHPAGRNSFQGLVRVTYLVLRAEEPKHTRRFKEGRKKKDFKVILMNWFIWRFTEHELIIIQCRTHFYTGSGFINITSKKE